MLSLFARACRRLTLSALLLAPRPSAAHDWGALGWDAEPWVLVSLALAGGLYALGARRLRPSSGSGKAAAVRASVLFAAGWTVLLLALVSPVDALGAQLFSAHMLQHELLMLLAAPLLVLGRPLATWIWAFPAGGRRLLGAFVRRRWIAGPWSLVNTAAAAWLLHAAALWLWHMPLLFGAAQADADVHVLQHASFLVSALLFWNVVLRDTPRTPPVTALIYLLTTMVHTGALGALLTFSSHVWYPLYGGSPLQWDLTPLEDQQLGGLIMWVPGGTVYLAVALAVIGRWLRDSPSPAPSVAAPGTQANKGV